MTSEITAIPDQPIDRQQQPYAIDLDGASIARYAVTGGTSGSAYRRVSVSWNSRWKTAYGPNVDDQHERGPWANDMTRRRVPKTARAQTASAEPPAPRPHERIEQRESRHAWTCGASRASPRRRSPRPPARPRHARRPVGPPLAIRSGTAHRSTPTTAAAMVPIRARVEILAAGNREHQQQQAET